MIPLPDLDTGVNFQFLASGFNTLSDLPLLQLSLMSLHMLVASMHTSAAASVGTLVGHQGQQQAPIIVTYATTSIGKRL